MPLAVRRRVRVAAVVAAVGAAYGAGVMTGAAGGSHAESGRSVLQEAEDRITAQAAHPVGRDALDRAAVEGMLRAIDDRWSAYYTPADYAHFRDVLDGRYSGVGVWVRRDHDGRLSVASVQAGSPAERAGVLVGDVIVAVGGRPVGSRSVVDVVSDLRGDAGSVVTVQVDRRGDVRTLSLRRVALGSDDVSRDLLAPGVVRLRVTAFTRGVGRWVRHQAADAEAERATGIVLDLRDNPGGLLDEAVETASAFLDGGLVVSYVQRGAAPQHLDALGAGETTTPLVVLVDGGTASAAEVVAAALRDRGRAVVVGSRTFGKGSVQEPTRLSDGSALELTVGRYLTPSGRSLDGVGLDPDVQVRPGSAPQVAEQRAVEVLSGMLADTGSSGRG